MARDVEYRDAWLRRRMAAELNETEVAVLRLAATLLDRLAADATADADDAEVEVDPDAGTDTNAATD
jgi:hypothetical protein